jgi:hypothetical protein
MKSIKFTLGFNAILLFISSIKEILNSHCGADDLKLKPINLEFDKETTQKMNKKLTAAAYTPIKIGMDYTSFQKPSSMTTSNFNTIKSIIDETTQEFAKFLKVQHTNIDLSGAEDKIKQGCEVDAISSDYKNFLKTNDLIVFPTFSNKLGSSILAAAGYCLSINDANKRKKPIAGILLINQTISFDKQNTKQYMKSLLLHEMTHILVFSPNLMADLGLTTKRSSVTYVTSNNVLIKARQHFNCATITGVPLEDQGGQGSAGSHWEARHMLGDYMISTNYIDNVISDITIALFEDSGLYEVEYFSGGLFKYGKNKGCSFLNNKCIVSGSPISEEFCVTPRQPMCTQSRASKAFCGIYQYSSVPSQYQYFTNPTYGGFLPVNYCPVANAADSQTVYYPTNCKVGTSTLASDFGETFGSNSFCFLSSLLPSSSSLNTTYQSICYRVTCNPSSKQIIINIGSSTVTCQGNGGTVNEPPGFKGYITCPKYTDICDAEDNAVCNDPFDCLSNEVEADEDSYEYDRNNQDFTRISNPTSNGNSNGNTIRRSSGENIKMNYILFIGFFLFLIVN